MKLAHRILLGFLSVVSMIVVVGYFAVTFSKKALEQSYIEQAETLIVELADKIDRHIFGKIEVFQEYSKDLILQEAVLKSNEYFEGLDDIQGYINKRDAEWAATTKGEMSPFIKSLFDNELSEELREKTEYYQDRHGRVVFPEVIVTNLFGANVAMTGKTTDYRQDDEKWWQVAKREGLFVGDVAYEESAEIYSVDVGIRVDDEHGRCIGVIKVALNFDEVVAVILGMNQGRVSVGHKAKDVYLVNNEGRLLYSNSAGQEFYSDVSGLFEQGHFNDTRSGAFLNRKHGDILYVHAHSQGFMSFKGLDWNLVIGYGTDNLFAPVERLRNRILAAALFSIIFAIAASLMTARSISRKLFLLKEATYKIGRGDLDVDVGIHSQDEIGQLAGAVRKMAGDLKTTTVNRDELAKEVAERKKMQDVIVQARVEWEETFDSISDVVLIIDNDFTIVRANKAAETVLEMQLSEIVGKKYYKIYHGVDHPLDTCASCQSLKTGTASCVNIFRPGIDKYLDIYAFPRFDKNNQISGLVHIAKDVTEQKKVLEEQRELQSQLRHAQKLESIGTLAGGIAHDFNNILGVIIGFGGIIEMKLKEDDPIRSPLKEIFKASERATHLTQSLLTFSRKQIIKIETINLNEIVNGVKKMLARIIGEDIELETIQIDRDPIVTADYGQIEQVLMNLATNARDVMPDGGRLSIVTSVVEMDDGYRKLHGYGASGKYALLSVTDTGTGMDEKTREKIFEPFFTTKETGRGTGLGLAIVYGIVKQHHGYIDVSSEPGRGSTFNIYLPLTESGVEKAEPVVAPPPAGGTETILVAEDEEQLRKLMKAVLEGAGYAVVEAEDGIDAVNKFRENSGKIRLLLFDVIMPGKNGKEAFEDIRKINPDIKCIYTSGYTADILHKKGMFDAGVNCLAKPIAPGALLRKIRAVLDT